MESLLADLRFALRTLRKRPGFTLVAVLSLALGIGANSIIFSLVNAMLLRTPAVADPGRVVALFTKDALNPALGLRPTSHLNWKDYREHARGTRPDLHARGRGQAGRAPGGGPFLPLLAAADGRRPRGGRPHPVAEW